MWDAEKKKKEEKKKCVEKKKVKKKKKRSNTTEQTHQQKPYLFLKGGALLAHRLCGIRPMVFSVNTEK